MPKREKQLQFRVFDYEDTQFREVADTLDMGISDFLRKAAKLGAAQLLLCPELRTLDLEYVPGADKKQ